MGAGVGCEVAVGRAELVGAVVVVGAGVGTTVGIADVGAGVGTTVGFKEGANAGSCEGHAEGPQMSTEYIKITPLFSNRLILSPSS